MDKSTLIRILGTAVAAGLGAVASMIPAPFNMIATAVAGALAGAVNITKPGDQKVVK